MTATFYECHPEDGCEGKYRYDSLDSFRKHRSQKHKLPQFVNVHDVCEGENHNDDDDNTSDSAFTCNNELPLVEVNNVPETQSFEELLTHDLLCIFSDLYTLTDVNRKRVRDVIQIFSDRFLQGKAFKYLQKSISETLCHENLNQYMSDFSNSLQTYSTESRQFQFLSSKGKFTEPVSYKIGERKDYKIVNGQQTAVSVDLKATFIPLRETLKNFFEVDDIFSRTLFYMDQLMENQSNSSSQVITNFIQGEYWKEIRSNYSSEKIVLPLIIYFDEFEVDNALGSHAGLNKIGGVYCSVPCLPIEFQSKLENIFLVILFNVLDRKSTEDIFLFTKLIEELNFLSSTGITICTKNGDFIVFFQMVLLIGDNLGMHSLMGFVESFSSNFPCRFCMIQKSELRNVFHEKDCILRTIDVYNECLRINDLSQTGIKRTCVFNSVLNFHIMLAPCVDIMHDILEGVADYDLGFILNHYIYILKYFTLDHLNQRLQAYAFDSNDMRSKPPTFTNKLSKEKISLSSSETACLIQNISLMIGDFVPKNDKFWPCITMLRNIMNVTFSTQFQVEVPDFLQTLITEYLTKLTELGLSLRPKHHYMLHYSRIMRLMGPLGKLSSMRYESKHRINKIIANATTSRLNICKTIAIKNQLKFCQRLLNNDGNSDIFECGPIDSESLQKVYGRIEKVCLVKYIKFLGHEIKPNKNVLIRPSENYLEMLLVENIMIRELHKVVLSCKPLKYNFDPHLDAFEIESNVCADDGDEERETLDVYNLYECMLTYKVFWNEKTYVLKKFV